MLFDEETFEILFISSSETAVCICSLENQIQRNYLQILNIRQYFFIILWSKISIFELGFSSFFFP